MGLRGLESLSLFQFLMIEGTTMAKLQLPLLKDEDTRNIMIEDGTSGMRVSGYAILSLSFIS